jgi:hypothetical protein
MRGMKRQFTLLILVLCFISCEQNDYIGRNTVGYFEKHLKPGMTHATVMAVFGDPVKDIGSGIHIYVYVLKDSTEVWIGITDTIRYANHLDKNQQLIKELI